LRFHLFLTVVPEPDRGKESILTTLPIAEPYELTITRHGVMLANRNDVYMGQALIRYGDCQEMELQFLLSLLRFPGLVIEVGSNMGLHTVPMAAELARQGRILLAFEPQPVIFQQLCANLALNGLLNVTALPYACGKENGSVVFEVPDYCHKGNYGSTSMSFQPHSNARHQTVQCARLDDLVPDGDVGMMKIDVEGFEQMVLEGATTILQRSKPALYVENDRIQQSPALIQWLFDHDYRLWWHLPYLFNPKNFRGIHENDFPGIVSINMFCLHRSSPVKVEGMEEVLDPEFHPLANQAQPQPTPAPPPPPPSAKVRYINQKSF
jgi:FkbM family methyltransferase